ncbi:50S ribosomal protein L4 [Patescibacteria group bacterium]|nr:50S ribosomal protein L4 [Patescibacteria group bacterium]
MANVSLYNLEGKSIGQQELADVHFGIKVNPALVHEAIVAQRANARHAIASTKTKGMVRGGGKKPWKQKGTGRARQGSIRSPQWVGGGVAFGPSSERNFSLKINRKAKQKALFMVLSDKVAHNKFLVLESLALQPVKTKSVAALMTKLPIEKTVLFVVSGAQPELMRMVRNLQHIKLVSINSLNILDVLTYRTVIFSKEAVAAFEQLYA